MRCFILDSTLELSNTNSNDFAALSPSLANKWYLNKLTCAQSEVGMACSNFLATSSAFSSWF